MSETRACCAGFSISSSKERLLLVCQFDGIREYQGQSEHKDKADGHEYGDAQVEQRAGKHQDDQSKDVQRIDPFARMRFNELPFFTVRAFPVVHESKFHRIGPTPLIIAVSAIWHSFLLSDVMLFYHIDISSLSLNLI